MSADAGAVAAAETGRPGQRLPILMLLQLSVYWLGINAIWAALGIQALPNIVVELKGKTDGPIFLTVLGVTGALVAMVVQPAFGSISDYTMSRWGRRKPFILAGATLDVVFLLGIALAPGFEVLLVFVVLLQFSSNLAQGPFQGYVPDLVPGEQVGLASGLMGLMIVLGQALGAALIFASVQLHDQGVLSINGRYGLGILGVGLFELATALTTVLFVREGRAAKPRGRRSWLDVVRSTWAADILRERSYLWLLGSRLLILTASALLLVSAQYYMQWSLGLSVDEALGWALLATIIVGTATGVAVIPAGLASDRIGRKRVIYLAAILGSIGMGIAAAAPNILVALGAALFVGLGAGTFLAVDWALMTDIIPKASSGRYMGISNVATGLGSGVVPILLTGIVLTGTSRLTGVDGSPLGPRLLVGGALVLFALGALALRPVDERRRVEDLPALVEMLPG
jgi:MFS family permease